MMRQERWPPVILSPPNELLLPATLCTLYYALGAYPRPGRVCTLPVANSVSLGTVPARHLHTSALCSHVTLITTLHIFSVVHGFPFFSDYRLEISLTRWNIALVHFFTSQIRTSKGVSFRKPQYHQGQIRRVRYSQAKAQSHTTWPWHVTVKEVEQCKHIYLL